MFRVQRARREFELDSQHDSERDLQRLPGDSFDRSVHYTAEFIADYGDNVRGHHSPSRSDVLLCDDGGGERYGERQFESSTGHDTFAVSRFLALEAVPFFRPLCRFFACVPPASWQRQYRELFCFRKHTFMLSMRDLLR
jgi:hypothetical protein